MKVITYGDIMDGGNSVFTSVAKVDGTQLLVSFSGVVRIDNPYKQLEHYLHELEAELPNYEIVAICFDFTELSFCNSNGFYVIMDIIEAIYNNTSGPVQVRRLREDDWQQETLPILIDMDEDAIGSRTTFIDVEE